VLHFCVTESRLSLTSILFTEPGNDFMTQLQGASSDETHPLRDSLTKALSRPHFTRCIEDEKSRSDASGLPFVLCLIDVDKLRNVNDEFGHKVGDLVLAELASRLRGKLDELDWDYVEYLHARFDGGAIILLARDCSIKRGARLAESLRAAINSEPFADRLTVTTSIAVTEYQIGESVDSVLNRTEKTLYLAKQFGSDHIEIAAAPRVPPACNVVPLVRRRTRDRRRISNG